MPTPPDPSAASRLNANPDPGHASYKVLGLLSWGVLIFSMVAFVAAPRLLLDVARAVAIYMMVRFILLTFFYLAGLVGLRRTEKRLSADADTGLSGSQLAIHHLVVIPNYEEPLDILSRTLGSLSAQSGAPASITVVLGMEEREPAARDKAVALLALFQGRFHGLSAAFHPADLPGQAPGKATNQTWAVRLARRELVDSLGIPSDRIVVTVADADSLFHPGYFAELTRRFAAAAHPHDLFWQAPILLDTDIWRTNPFIRLVTFFSNALSTGDFFNPWAARIPYSTYSLSLQLLEQADYWDPTAVAEDQNLFLRAFFKKSGRVFVERIFLPVHANPVHGASLWDSLGIFYNQKVRQGLGGAGIGYLLQKWALPPGAPFFFKLGRLLKLIHDHLFFSTAGFIVALGTLLSILLDHAAVITLPPVSFSPLLFAILNALGGSVLLVTWFTERLRLSRGRRDWSLKTLAGELAAWAVFPLLFFLLMNLPGLQAQTNLLLGQSIPYQRTPKALDARIGD